MRPDAEVPGRHRVAEEFLPLQLLSMLRLRVLSLAGCWNVHIPLCVGELQDLRQLVVRDCNKLTFKEGAFLRNTFAALSLTSVTLINCNLHAVPYQVQHLSTPVPPPSLSALQCCDAVELGMECAQPESGFTACTSKLLLLGPCHGTPKPRLSPCRLARSTTSPSWICLTIT